MPPNGRETSLTGMAMQRVLAALLAISFAVVATSCAGPPSMNCTAPWVAAVSETIYFGTAKANGVVTAEEWTDFLDQSITPRFPSGLTTWRALGQWQSAGGAIVRESTIVLALAHGKDILSEQAVEDIATEYKTRFGQEAVLRVRSAVCHRL